MCPFLLLIEENMKVRTKKPFTRWTTYEIEQRYVEWRDIDHLSEKDYPWFDKVVIGFFDLWQSVLNLTVNKIFENEDTRVKVKIDHWDTWCISNSLTPVILPLLKQLKEQKHGSPFVDDKDVPKELRSPKGFDFTTGATDPNWHLRWEWVLDEMIWAFNELNSDWESQFHTGKSDFEFVEIEIDGEIFYQMVRGPNDTSHFDAKGYEKHAKRIERGTMLFGKYYTSLWS